VVVVDGTALSAPPRIVDRRAAVRLLLASVTADLSAVDVPIVVYVCTNAQHGQYLNSSSDGLWAALKLQSTGPAPRVERSVAIGDIGSQCEAFARRLGLRFVSADVAFGVSAAWEPPLV
jgi:hypothetical protein